MSEYQYYEFLAMDRPLTKAQQAEVRALSTRATISSTGFTNEYQWGDFSGNPARMMERYYDAHLYYANWGTRRVMLRLPASVVSAATVERYLVDGRVDYWVSGENIIIDLTSEEEEEFWEEDVDRTLAAIAGVRTELASGDLRPLYLAWLAAYGAWERDESAFEDDDEDEQEPHLPPGLGDLTAAQQALADFLRLGPDLLAIAAQASPAVTQAPNDPRALAARISALPATRKDAFLLRVARNDGARVRLELLHDAAGQRPEAASEGERTVGALLDAAAVHRQAHEEREAAQRAREEALREQDRKRARERHLDDLARTQPEAWARVEALISTTRPRDYDEAVALLCDLQTLSYRDDQANAFTEAFTKLRERHLTKPSLIKRFDKAALFLA